MDPADAACLIFAVGMMLAFALGYAAARVDEGEQPDNEHDIVPCPPPDWDAEPVVVYVSPELQHVRLWQIGKRPEGLQ